MREGTRTALLVEGRLDEEIVKRVIASTEEASPDDRIRVGLEAAVGVAETDQAAGRAAPPRRAPRPAPRHRTPAKPRPAPGPPDLQGLMPVLLRWLEGDW